MAAFILESSVDPPSIVIVCIATATYVFLVIHPIGESAFTFDCTFFRLTCLTAKAVRRITMCGFLVGAIELKKRTLKRVQLRILGSLNRINKTTFGAESVKPMFL